MKLSVEEHGTAELVAAFTAAPEKIRRGWAEEAFTIGASAVERIRRQYRTVGSATSTWRRSGALARSYAHEVKRQSGETVLTVGAIRPTDAGQVPLQARVQEGFDAQGNKVSQFVIRPKTKPYLRFPIRQGGGLSAGNIVRWVTTKGPVILHPRPALEPVGQEIVAELVERGATVVTDAA